MYETSQADFIARGEAANRGNVWNGGAQNIALQIFYMFDYENLHRLMRQIRPSNGHKLGNRRHIEKSIHLPRRTVA